MILEEETHKKFGYCSRDLSFGSAKRILVICDKCRKKREIRFQAYRPFCRSCAKERKTKIRRICKYCDKEFFVNPSIIKNGWGIFCSRGCKQRYCKGKNSSHWKGGKIKKICNECGGEFEIYLSQVKKGKGIFCSHSCHTINMRRNRNTYLTKPELIFEQICKKNNLPFKYTGDGSLWIGKNPAVNPDFVECNGKKIAVEIFGDYWHSPLFKKVPYNQTYEGRKKIFKKYGWKLIIFWEADLKRMDAEQFVLLRLSKY